MFTSASVAAVRSDVRSPKAEILAPNSGVVYNAQNYRLEKNYVESAESSAYLKIIGDPIDSGINSGSGTYGGIGEITWKEKVVMFATGTYGLIISTGSLFSGTVSLILGSHLLAIGFGVVSLMFFALWWYQD